MKKKISFTDLVQLMARLRGPNGCPWDKEQTHDSLLRYLKEETEELVQGLRKKDWVNVEEELGDVLLQILFHAQLAAEKKKFSINDVLATLHFKLVNRHPHVFGRHKNKKWTSDDVRQNWATIKAAEKKKRKARR